MSFFRRKRASPEEAVNPYVTARRYHANIMNALAWSAKAWQYLALMCLLLTLAAVGGVIVLGTQSRLVPYVVEVDKLGQTAAVKRADRAGVADERIVRASLASFIRDSRMVSFDRHVQNEAIWRLFSMLKTGDPALQKMTEYMKDEVTSPTKRAESESVGVEIIAVLQQNPQTWEITWTETTWNRAGQQIRRQLMRGLVSVYTVPPTSSTKEDDIFRNPLGLYIKDFSWSRIVE